MRFYAIHCYARISATKVRLVIDMIRGKSANEALRILKLVQKRASGLIKKVLASAIANAEQKGSTNLNDLFIVEVIANNGPMWKRYRPGPMGRAMRIRKRTAHIKVVLEEKAKVKVEPKKVELKKEEPKIVAKS